MWSFRGNWIFRSIRTIMRSDQQWIKKVSVVPYPCQCLVLLLVFTLVTSVDMYWYLIVVLICISLMMLSIFICLFDICISSFGKYLFKHFAHFLVWVILLLSCKNFYILDKNPEIYVLWIFCPHLWLAFLFS